jgi:hypothetical protein
MPIRFRCGYCNRLLGIARRKAGQETTCPHCGYTLTVPEDAIDEAPDISGMEDLDELLNPMSMPEPQSPPPPAQTSPGSYTATRPLTSPAVTAAPTTPRPATPVASPPRSSGLPGDRPMLGPSFESVLNAPGTAKDPRLAAKPAPSPGVGAMGLPDDRGHIVLSARKAAFLAIAVVILVGVSFVAGFLLASYK